MKSSELLIEEAIFARAELEKGKVKKDADGNYQFSVSRTATCVVDTKDNKAIDIETCEVFDIVKREHGVIVHDEFDRILDGEEHLLRLQPKDWSRISLLYQLSLKDRAKHVYKRYLNSVKERPNVKVKKINKKGKH